MSVARTRAGAFALAVAMFGLCLPAEALIINPGETGRYDFSFSSPSPGPFDVAFMEVDGTSLPNTQFSYDLQMYDKANTLLVAVTETPFTFSDGNFFWGHGNVLPNSTVSKKGYVLITDLSQTINVSLFRVGLGSSVGGGTEVIDASPGFHIVDGDGPPTLVPEPTPLKIMLAALVALGLFPALKQLRLCFRSRVTP